MRAAAAREIQPTPKVPRDDDSVPQSITGEVVVSEEEMIIPEDMEHLQLTLQEAYFLCWGLGCLRILDPSSVSVTATHYIHKTYIHSSTQQGQYIPPQSLLSICLPAYSTPLPDLPHEPARTDNPFLINYVVYHHYRSLGWVVRGGIKFCVDYMLYKRGPVFSHAE